jgi:hypothetical protein
VIQPPRLSSCSSYVLLLIFLTSANAQSVSLVSSRLVRGTRSTVLGMENAGANCTRFARTPNLRLSNLAGSKPEEARKTR